MRRPPFSSTAPLTRWFSWMSWVGWFHLGRRLAISCLELLVFRSAYAILVEVVERVAFFVRNSMTRTPDNSDVQVLKKSSWAMTRHGVVLAIVAIT